MNTRKKKSTLTLVMGAILTALVIVLQFMGAFIRFGPFSISLVLIPIVIGAAVCGVKISTWLGFVFGVVVLLSGDAAVFFAVNELGTVVTVLAKGTMAGLLAGLCYRWVLAGLNKLSAVKIRRMKNRYGLGECCENGVYDYITRNNKYAAVLVSAIVCPMTNTGIFLLGCLVFFMDTVSGWAEAANLGGNVGQYLILVLVGANFLFELASNIILSPVIVRIVQARKKV